MTKQEIANALIEAGLDRFLVDSFWQGDDCFVSFFDLMRCNAKKVKALADGARHAQTDKGFVFFAQVAA